MQTERESPRTSVGWRPSGRSDAGSRERVENAPAPEDVADELGQTAAARVPTSEVALREWSRSTRALVGIRRVQAARDRGERGPVGLGELLFVVAAFRGGGWRSDRQPAV